ncbi:hypothetical protein [Kitasatospora purpeofusca]|uniref:hypothetical protein n=1 Tax=Kitasatospora purpeofusca TaxID=67352 RepID=UPI003867EE6E|nr:hypothetical protein OIP63_32460 [Kitasatospora purpeofusca]
MTDQPFVPADFTVPRALDAEGFRPEPLGEQHNEDDHAARLATTWPFAEVTYAPC